MEFLDGLTLLDLVIEAHCCFRISKLFLSLLNYWVVLLRKTYKTEFFLSLLKSFIVLSWTSDSEFHFSFLQSFLIFWLSSSSELLQSLLLDLNYTNLTLSASYTVLSVPRPPNLSFLNLILSSYVRFCAASITIFWGFYYIFCSGSGCDGCDGCEAKTSNLAAGDTTGLVWAGTTIFCSYFLG